MDIVIYIKIILYRLWKINSPIFNLKDGNPLGFSNDISYFKGKLSDLKNGGLKKLWYGNGIQKDLPTELSSDKIKDILTEFNKWSSANPGVDIAEFAEACVDLKTSVDEDLDLLTNFFSKAYFCISLLVLDKKAGKAGPFTPLLPVF